ncbi:MAG TPA: Gfo/Idh/MocA family oxidoreductase [bacterium]|nr:Gfo/Idh/MocA family oxidoreductase [bacterium]
MGRQRQIMVGMIGAGFIAETRARCYATVSGYDVRIAAVAGRSRDHAEAYARRHGVPDVYGDYREILARRDIDIVDLCVPNHLHRPMTEEAAAAGKHVICSKPLTAFDGQGLPAGTEVAAVPRTDMLRTAVESADAMLAAAERAHVRLMYAENWVYAPSIAKADRLAAAAGGVILEMRGGECHSGSHSPYAKEWRYTGGGALLRLGVHPIGAMLHLKRREGLRRTGRPIRPRAVVADVGDLTRAPAFQQEERHWIGTGWVDVENWGCLIITFDDGARGIVWASDAVLGGMESALTVFLSNAHIKCSMEHTGLVQAFAPDPSIFEDEYLMEKLETKAGWSAPAPDEDWAQGHRQALQDFVESVAEEREPIADGRLGRDAIEVVYAGYVAAADGRRVELGR